MNATRALQLRAKTDGGSELDQGWLICDSLAFLDRSLDAFQIVVTIIDDFRVPTIRFKSQYNIFGKGTVGVTVDGDVIVVVDRNKVP